MTNSLGLIFSCLTVISALVFLGSIIFLHFLPSKFNPVKNTVSDYVASFRKLHPFITTAMPLSGAVSSFSLAIAIISSTKTASMSIILFLIISSVCRMFVVFFPTDVMGKPSTKTGKIHLILAMIAFSGIAFAAGNFHLKLLDEIIGQIVIIAAVLLLLGFLPPFKKIFGLLERFFLFSSIIWLVTVGSELFLKG